MTFIPSFNLNFFYIKVENNANVAYNCLKLHANSNERIREIDKYTRNSACKQ